MEIHDPDELGRDELVAILRKVQDALWPGGDRDHEWSPDTADEVASALIDGGLGPDYSGVG